jgi:hypothetical protein
MWDSSILDIPFLHIEEIVGVADEGFKEALLQYERVERATDFGLDASPHSPWTVLGLNKWNEVECDGNRWKGGTESAE